MTLELRDIAERLGQTTIRLGIDLSRVQSLGPGESLSFLSDVTTEVYVVQRWGDGGEATVHALSINADAFVISPESRP